MKHENIIVKDSIAYSENNYKHSSIAATALRLLPLHVHLPSISRVQRRHVGNRHAYK